MVKTIEGVRVDESEFPNSYELAEKARGIALHFKFPVQDALQELMYLEFTSRKKRLDNAKGYLICSLYQNSMLRHVRDKNKMKREAEVAEFFYMTFDREALRDQIFVNELSIILSKIDESLSEMLMVIQKNIDKSLHQIYQSKFSRKMSSHEFYQRMKRIRTMAKEFAKRGWVPYDTMPDFKRTVKCVS